MGLFPAEMLRFWEVIRRIDERARARGILGSDGSPIWSIGEWKRFVQAAREHKHWKPFGFAVYRTVTEVEALLADGHGAREIHEILVRINWDDNDNLIPYVQEKLL